MFAQTPAAAHRAVIHLHHGAPGVPVYLFTAVEPEARTAGLCEHVFVHRSPLALLLRAQRELWGCWVALGVAEWTGEPGSWPLKLAPFLVPPFRVLVLNAHGDFFRGSPGAILRHHWDRWRGPLFDALELFVDAAWVTILWVASKVFPLGYLHCRLFARLHGRASLRVEAPPSHGSDIAEFEYDGLEWHADRLERLARSTTARWILWKARGSAGISAPFEAPEVFAFSLQEHYRAWKPVIIPTAPFRQLQEGEAAQVAAPLSSTILVDRRRLLALGIPRCHLAVTAWLLLFWKAAAAGWRSYSLGRGVALTEQPDLPVQETDFLLRVAFQPRLRRLGPREPALGRGALAFSARHREKAAPGTSGRLRVLLVSPFLPYPLSHGGAVRIFNLCRSLAPRVDFCLIAVREAGEAVDYDRLHQVFSEVFVVDLDERAAEEPGLPAQVRGHRSSVLEALIAEVVRDWDPDLLQIEYTHMAAFQGAAPHVPAILVEHDLTFTLYQQLAATQTTAAAQEEYRRWLEFERRWLAAYDGVWTVSPEDRAIAVREGSRDSGLTFHIPNGVDTNRFVPSGPADSLEILYVGSFRHLPNILGFQKLRQEVMPRIWNALPGARLTVVAGPRHDEFWGRFANGEPMETLDPRIGINGFVEDLRPFYARAAVVVIPLEVSAGTNIKVLEAMACGKAIVTTPVGCAGLSLVSGVEALVASEWDEFAGAVRQLLRDPDLRHALGMRARRTAEERFSWTAIAESAYRSYRTVADCRCRLSVAGD